MQRGGGGAWQLPVPRLPTIVTSSSINFLPLPVPAEPSNAAGGKGSGGTAAPAAHGVQADTLPPPALLHAVCEALLHADTSGIHLRHVPHAFAPQHGTLEHALADLNPHVFHQAARGVVTPQSQPQPQQQQPPPQPPPPSSSSKPTRGRQQQQQQQQAAAAAPTPPTPAAAAAAADETPQPAKRRRKSAAADAATEVAYVSRAVDAQQVAADVAEAVSSFLAKAGGSAADSAAAGDGDEAGDAAAAAAAAGSSSRGRARKGQKQQQQRAAQPARSGKLLPLELLRQLQGSLAAGKQAGIIAQLDHEHLRQLLLLLLGQVQLGQDTLLAEDEQAGSDASTTVAVALEAACCCMQALAAPGLPNALYLDELLTATVGLAKYHLQYNVLALHDPQYRRLYRPAAAAAGDGAAPATGRKRGRSDAASRLGAPLADVRAKLELLLALLAQVVQRVLLEVERLLPLVRIGLTCLSVDSLQLVQAQAIALAVAVFRAYPAQRPALIDEVLGTVVANVHAGARTAAGRGGPPRLYEATGADLQPLPIQMASALIMQLVQASVSLPDMDADPKAITAAFSKAAYPVPDQLWRGMFDRLPAAKAAKSDGGSDIKAVMHAMLADLLAVQMLPEWPSATLLLRAFVKVLAGDKGIRHKDPAVKLAAVEFAGQLAASLCAEALAADSAADDLQAVKEVAQAAADPALLEGCADPWQQLPDLLLLDYLAAGAGSSASSSSDGQAARSFVCCRMLHDAIQQARAVAAGGGADDLTPQQLMLLLVQHRRLQDASLPLLAGAAPAPALARPQAVALVRQWVSKGPLGAGRAALIKWLLEAGSRSGPEPSPASVRTKVFKCLGGVLEADARVMALGDVAEAVRAALADDSVAVREAALELLTRLIATNPGLAGEYFDLLLDASYDSGVSVRKRAIRALWDCCTCAGFARAADAVVAVLQRATDQEESMRALVTKVVGEMWFTDSSSFAGLTEAGGDAGGGGGARTPVMRAHELATVALHVYEASGNKTIHMPLPPDHHLVLVLKEVLGTGASSGAGSGTASKEAREAKEHAVMRAGAAEVAEALLSLVLQQQEDGSAAGGASSAQQPGSGSSGGTFGYMLALHALCAADGGLAVPAADAQRFVRALAPYLPALSSVGGPLGGSRLSAGAPGAAPAAEEATRRTAIEGLCLLAVLDAALQQLGCAEAEVAAQMVADLSVVINKQRYLQLLAGACQLLCTLATMHEPAAAHVSQLVNKVHNIASGVLTAGAAAGAGPGTPGSPAQALTHVPRVLFIMGQLCKFGAATINAAAAKNPGNRNCSECLELCVSLWYQRDLPNVPASQRVRDAALQAVGHVIVGRPGLLLQPLALNLLEHQHSAGLTSGGGAGPGGGGLAAPAHSTGSGDGDSSPPHAGQQQQQLAAQGGSGLGQAVTAVRVYAGVLSGHSVPPATKTKVLASLVDLLRSEEVTLTARQKDAEAAAAAERLPTTEPRGRRGGAAKAPLARINGEADGAGVSSSGGVIQGVWKDVLQLATGVGGGGRSGGSSSGGAGGGLHTPPLGAGAVMEAAVMRRKALELIEVVMRGGLVAPWDAVPPLVAQLTDDSPDIRAAALKVLKAAAAKYADYVGTQLGPGVLEAFSFQARLWAAKHPDQPLPKGPSHEVLDGLSAMYADIVHPQPASRARFLTALLKPFEAPCNLAAAAGGGGTHAAAAAALQVQRASEDASRLAFLAHVAAALPYRRGDEPLVLLHAINSLVSRLAAEVRDVLRRALLRLGLREQMGLEDEDDEAAEAGGAAAAAAGSRGEAAAAADAQQPIPSVELSTEAPAVQRRRRSDGQQQPPDGQQQLAAPFALPLPGWVVGPLRSSLGLSMLLVLKQYLMAAFGLADERVAAYELKGERARAEAKALVSRSRKVPEFSLGLLNLRCLHDATGELLAEQYRTFAGLMDNDASNYREAAVLAALADQEADEGGWADGEDGGGGAPDTAAKHAATPAHGLGRRGGAAAAAAGEAAPGLVVYSMEPKGGRGSRGKAAVGGGKSGGGGSAKGGSKAKQAKGRKRSKRAADSSDDGDGGDDGGDASDEDWGGSAVKKKRLFQG